MLADEVLCQRFSFFVFFLFKFILVLGIIIFFFLVFLSQASVFLYSSYICFWIFKIIFYIAVLFLCVDWWCNGDVPHL